jgi:hypothetical protein|nr:MAG TPA: hypothetical protein [Caudoviricetes sp.]
MNKTINGVEFFSANHDIRSLIAFNTPEGADTLEDAKYVAEQLLEAYVELEPNNGYWSVEIDSTDGHNVAVSWSFDGDSIEGDEFIKTYVDGELLNDRNNACNLKKAYRASL